MLFFIVINIAIESSNPIDKKTDNFVNIINFKLANHQTIRHSINKPNVFVIEYPQSGKFLNTIKLIGKVTIEISSSINSQANIG